MPKLEVALEHLSYSSISTFTLCPKAWYFHYVEKLEAPRSAALVFGSAFHDAAEAIVTASARKESVDPATCFQVHWTREVERGPVNWGGESPDALVAEGVRLITHPQTAAILDRLTPMTDEHGIVVEREVRLTVPGVPLPVIGYIDLVTQDGIPTDLKTAGRAWSPERASEETQPLYYLAALNQARFPLNPERKFRHVVWTKGAKAPVQEFVTQRTLGGLFWLFDLIQDVWQAIQASSFPCNTGTWKCSPKYCEYWHSCMGKLYG